MSQAKSGDTVRIHYTGRLDDGTVFKTSCGGKPLTFKIGKSKLIPAFQETVVGMKPGTSRTIKIVANEAYGSRSEEMVVAVARNKFPEHIRPYVGLELDVHQRNGKIFPSKVIDVTECSVTLDANHPLAGKDVTFDIELVEII
jgi:peptidylprolyl isomerase